MPKHLQMRSFIGFLVSPTYPVAELIVDTYRSLSAAWRSGNSSGYAYHFAACRGLSTMCKDGGEEDALFLLDLDPDLNLLQRSTEPRNPRWAPCVLTIVVFLAQDLSVIVLYFCRISHLVQVEYGETRQFTTRVDAEFDNINAQYT